MSKEHLPVQRLRERPRHVVGIQWISYSGVDSPTIPGLSRFREMRLYFSNVNKKVFAESAVFNVFLVSRGHTGLEPHTVLGSTPVRVRGKCIFVALQKRYVLMWSVVCC